MIAYDTVSEAVNGLKQRGFVVDFNLEENCLVCHGDKFDINDFEIVEVFRFEGNTDPNGYRKASLGTIQAGVSAGIMYSTDTT